jgi:DNA-binding NtrC family response regulator
MFPESVILVVGSESDESESIASMLSDSHRVIGVEKPEDAISHASEGVDLVISQLDSPDFSGLQLLRMWKARDRRTPFLFVTEGGDVSSAVEAMKLGAADCLVKPINAGELRATVLRLLEAHSTSIGRTASDSDSGNRDEQRPNIDIPPGTSLEDLERVAVEQALAQHHGNRTHAAKTLGISVRTLQRKLKAWGIPVLTSLQPNGPSTNFLYSEHQSPHATPTPFSAHAH